MPKALVVIFGVLISISVSASPLYWKAKKGDLEYLIFGTVHVGDDTMFPLPKTVLDYLDSSDGLIVEVDINEAKQLRYPQSNISSYSVLNREQREELKGISELLKMDVNTLLQAPPWATALTVQLSQFSYLGYTAEQGIDIHLLATAAKNHIPLFTLETMQFQINLLASLEQEGKELLVSVVDDFDKAEPLTHCLVDSWKKGDKDKLEQFGELTALSPEFEATFITNRNLDWVQKLNEASFLPQGQGRYLIAVGTLHLVGKNNLPILLEKSGFAVEQISSSQKSECQFEY
ncbi:TraB/GumN family protein [Vibrio sonorensis]|uniref:TraB/GumN family protein n=1 Tax=Vibrio sonorensis TaxID=1004316 RepID=UPI0008D91EA7|nr:TraB/GumN family protein [Vibrio sonorensis]